MGRRLLIAVYLATSSASSALAQIPGVPPPPTGARPPPQDFQPQVSIVELPLPTMLKGAPVGDIPVRLSGDALLGVHPGRLVAALEEVLQEELLAQLRALGSDYATPETLASAGLRASYDPNALTLDLDVEAANFRDIEVFLSRRADYQSYELLEPSRFALGVDGSLLLSQRFNRGGDAQARLQVDGFANLGGIDGVYVDFAGGANLNRQEGEELLRRDRLTLFKDDRQRAIRYSALDVRPDPLPLLATPDFLGLGVERRYSEIRPEDIVRSTGQHSIVLDRPATVEVEVNGAVIRRFQSPAGRINLNDIPFVDLGNQVRIYVEDEFGRREVDAFSFSSRESLLATGVSEFGVAGGALQNGFSDGLEWDTEDYGAVGYYRRGMTQNLTIGAGAAVGEKGFAAITGGLVASLPYGGVGQLDAAWSRSDDPNGGGRSGLAVAASYDVDFDGLLHGRDQLSLRADYRSEDFTTLGGHGGGVESFSASGAYRFGLDDRSSMNLGASYARIDDRNDVSLRAGLARSFGALAVSASAEHLLREGRKDETRFLISASMPLGDDRRVRGSYSSARERVAVEYDKTHQNRVGQYGYALRAERDEDSAALYGRADYIGNRFEASATLDHVAESVDALLNDDSPLVGALRLSSGIAVADGRIGVGRNVGNGFLLVDTHPSLRESRLSIGDDFGLPPLVRKDGWGPMVAPMSGDYRFSQVSLNIEEAPIGYDVGSGVYAMQGGARVGAATMVGDDAFYSARGVLVTSQGEPLKLQYGRLSPASGEGPSIDIFTNSTGVFFASGLAPGSYLLEIAGERSQLEIAAPSSGALIELGQVTLRGGT